MIPGMEPGDREDLPKANEPTTLELALDFLQQQVNDDCHNWFPHLADSMPHHVIGVMKELGEVADILAEIERYPDRWNDDMALRLIFEFIDVWYYATQGISILQGSLYHAYMAKRQINNERFLDASGSDSPDGTASLLPQQQGPLGAGAFVSTRDTLLP
jgi:hypothetical protein